MSRAVFVVLIVVAGCSRPSSLERPALEQSDAANAGAPPSGSTSAGDSGESSNFSSDLGDRVVASAVAPDIPALPPIERSAVAPKPRIAPASITDPDSTTKGDLRRPVVVPVENSAVRLDPPIERVPPDLGAGAGAVPAKPKVPVATAPIERSRDVNLPPPWPALGRQAADRVGFDDPTTDLANDVITGPRVSTPFAPAPFLKVGVPNPFELAEQMKATIQRTTEPDLTPAIVNPRRPK